MSDEVVVVADVLLDGSGGEALERPAVTIAGERFGDVVGRGDAWHVPTGATVVDLSGCTLLPGLIDAHVHLALEGATGAETIAFAERASDAELDETMRRHALESLRGGVTAVRDLGSPRRSARMLRDASRRGEATAPRLVVAGRPITTATGHCHWMGLIAHTADELRAAVHELADEDVDLVKVMATGGMMTPGSDPYRVQYSAEELRALVEAAHARERPVAAHVLCTAGLLNAIAAGVDTIEHGWTITGKRQDDSDEAVARFAESGILGSVTAHAALRGLLRAGELDELRRRLAPHRRLRAAGVELLVHSDAGTPGTSFGDFALSVEAYRSGMGVSAEESVRAATSLAARALRLEHEIGLVAPGRLADLLAVRGDLRDDATALRAVERVWQGGRSLVEGGELRVSA
jgi:imidazolonepropionase-like amidohydrolase